MGQVLKIDHDEAALLAQEWMALTGRKLGPTLCDPSRRKLKAERKRRKRVADMVEVTDRFADLLDLAQVGA